MLGAVKTRTIHGHCAKKNGTAFSGPGASAVLSKSSWLRGVDLNHRPLGYEATEDSNFNNLQDAGGSVNPCKYE